MRSLLVVSIISVTLCVCLGIFPYAATTAYGEDKVPSSDQAVEDVILGAPSQQLSATLPSQDDAAVDIAFYAKDAEFRMLQEKHRMWLLGGIVISTPLMLALVLFCLKKIPNCSSESLVNAVGLILVIEGTMFIGVSALTTEQLTAPIGLLGAIAGYLFGSARRKTEQA